MQSIIDFSQHSFLRKKLDIELLKDSSDLFTRHGALVIQSAFPKTLIKGLATEFHRQFEKKGSQGLKKHALEVGKDRYLTAIQIESVFNDPRIYASPQLLPILRTLLGNDCVLHAFGGICAFPGAEMQHFHTDHPPLFPEAGTLESFFPPYSIHISIPLVDINEETGTTAVWEGSHRRKLNENERKKMKSDEPLKEASLPHPNAGDCLLMDFRLWHRGTPNLSKKPRTFLYMVYSRSWFNDAANYQKHRRLKITKKELLNVPEQHRGLFSQYL